MTTNTAYSKTHCKKQHEWSKGNPGLFKLFMHTAHHQLA